MLRGFHCKGHLIFHIGYEQTKQHLNSGKWERKNKRVNGIISCIGNVL